MVDIIKFLGERGMKIGICLGDDLVRREPLSAESVFQVWKLKKASGAKSGEYGGCRNNSNFNSIILDTETAQVRTRALS